MKSLICKKQQAFSLVELIIVIVIIGVLASIAIPESKNYERRARWSKNINATTKPLQIAIHQCLFNNQGNISACNEFTPDKLASYGVTTAPKDEGYFLAVYVLKNNAAIKIVGSKCIADLVPHPHNSTVWDIVVSIPQNSVDSLKKCTSLINPHNKQLILVP